MNEIISCAEVVGGVSGRLPRHIKQEAADALN